MGVALKSKKQNQKKKPLNIEYIMTLSKNCCGEIYLQNPEVQEILNLLKRQNLLCSCNGTQLLALVSELAFSCTNRSKKVRDPRLRAEGTECLPASRCALLLPEVRGSAVPRLVLLSPSVCLSASPHPSSPVTHPL